MWINKTNNRCNSSSKEDNNLLTHKCQCNSSKNSINKEWVSKICNNNLENRKIKVFNKARLIINIHNNKAFNNSNNKDSNNNSLINNTHNFLSKMLNKEEDNIKGDMDNNNDDKN